MEARLRKWLRQKEAGKARERAIRRAKPLSANEAWKQALELVAFAEQLGRWPPRLDVKRRREDEQVARTWRKLKRDFANAWPPPLPRR